MSGALGLAGAFGFLLGIVVGLALVLFGMRLALARREVRDMMRRILDERDGASAVRMPTGEFPEFVTCKACDRRVKVPTDVEPICAKVHLICDCGADVHVRRSP